MYIGGIDESVTSMWDRVAEKERKYSERLIKKQRDENDYEKQMEEAQKVFEKYDEKVDERNTMEDMDSSYEPPPAYLQKTITSQNRHRLTNTAKACDRYLVSNRAGAAVASGVLEDYGIITDDDQSQVIGPTKIANERHRYRMEIREKVKEGRSGISSLYFDGKKTATRVLVKNTKTGRWSPQLQIQDHYVILEEPGSEYLTHVTPVSGHGIVIAKAIYDFLIDESLQDEPILTIGGDGTNVNVGAENGVIHHLEIMLGHPVHYGICQLHGN